MKEVGVQADLAAEFQAAGSRVRDAIDGLTEVQLSRPAMDGWSVKDHLNHLTIWHEVRFHEISRIARGGRHANPTLDTQQVDQLNVLLVSLRRDLPLSQVLGDLDYARSLVIQAVAGATDDALRDDQYGEVGVRGGIAHDLEHAETIRAWRRNEGI